MEDKIKQSFDKINNQMKQGFDSVLFLTQLTNSDELCNAIKKIEKWQKKTK